MAFYVDRLRKTRRTKCWPYDESCHLLADTERELRKIAVQLNLSPNWLHRSRFGMPHFDLNPSLRDKAIRFGAVEMINMKEVKNFIDAWKDRFEKKRRKQRTKGNQNV